MPKSEGVSRVKVLLCVLGFAAALTSGQLAARADFVGGEMVTVEISSDIGSGKLSWLIPLGMEKADQLTWGLPATAAVRTGDGELIGAVEYMDVVMNGDPAVALNFAFVAGAATTNFSITSALVSFAPINNPQAYATAALTVTDHDMDGASATGMLNGKVFEFMYNGSSTFAELVDPVSASPASSNVGSERSPAYPTIWATIPGSVSTIQSKFDFNLSANDAASATSYFEVVVPEPAALSLLLIGGGLALIRRRR